MLQQRMAGGLDVAARLAGWRAAPTCASLSRCSTASLSSHRGVCEGTTWRCRAPASSRAAAAAAALQRPRLARAPRMRRAGMPGHRPAAQVHGLPGWRPRLAHLPATARTAPAAPAPARWRRPGPPASWQAAPGRACRCASARGVRGGVVRCQHQRRAPRRPPRAVHPLPACRASPGRVMSHGGATPAASGAAPPHPRHDVQGRLLGDAGLCQRLAVAQLPACASMRVPQGCRAATAVCSSGLLGLVQRRGEHGGSGRRTARRTQAPSNTWAQPNDRPPPAHRPPQPPPGSPSPSPAPQRSAHAPAKMSRWSSTAKDVSSSASRSLRS